MGTATTNTGPKTKEWANAKRRATRWAKAGGGDTGSGVSGVVSAAATALAAGGGLLGSAGPRAGQRLGGLLSGFASTGVAPTLEARGLAHLVGLTGIDLLVALVDYVAEDEAGLESVAVRRAADAVFAEIIDELDVGEVVLDEERVERLLELYWGSYISSIVLQALDKSLMDAAPADAVRLRDEIRSTVLALLEHHLEGRSVLSIDWTGEEGFRIMDEIRTATIFVVRGNDAE